MDTVESLRRRLITNLALGFLREDDLCPDVGMGMFPYMALDKALKREGYTKADVDYDAILASITEQRRRR